ncbi:hypothetical protein [Devosia sp. Leaf64]|uniref:hypothetical protein n=1 Tax=Devosia sp. Leaf64 TaxID=1736229 RepID=UPI0012E164DD|nr:hypothetical protein [Devosia sp. Leaf64]
MGIFRSTSVASIGVVSALGAGSGYAQGLSDLQGMASLTGTCERLVMDGKDFSAGCSTTIIQSIYSTGRTGFTVTVGDKGTVVTFSGAEGAKPDPDSQLQSVDKVILNLGIEGVPPTSSATTGNCAYSNPYNGPMTISCQAIDDRGGAYLLQFRTDGSEPKFTDLDSSAETRPSSNPQEFTVGAWVGAPLADDPDGGCLMVRDVNQNVTLMVYANGNEAFELNFHNSKWALEPNANLDADLLFDGTTFPIADVEVRNPQVITLFGGGEEEGFQPLFESSSELVFRMGREQITVDLAGSSAATAKLWSCVSP